MDVVDIPLRDLIGENAKLKNLMLRFNINEEDQKSLVKSSEAMGLSPEFFLELAEVYADEEHFPAQELRKYSFGELVKYLKATHHYYLDKRLAEIEHMMHQIDIDENRAVLIDYLKEFFQEYKRKLSKHIEMEEGLLFPLLEGFEKEDFGLTREQAMGLLDRFELFHDHSIESDLIQLVEKLKRHYPEEKQLSDLRILIDSILNFEKDLAIHARIEDEVVLPKAQEYMQA